MAPSSKDTSLLKRATAGAPPAHPRPLLELVARGWAPRLDHRASIALARPWLKQNTIATKTKQTFWCLRISLKSKWSKTRCNSMGTKGVIISRAVSSSSRCLGSTTSYLDPYLKQLLSLRPRAMSGTSSGAPAAARATCTRASTNIRKSITFHRAMKSQERIDSASTL